MPNWPRSPLKTFGGKAFRPTAYAARPEFSPSGFNHTSKNPAFDNKAKDSQYKPGVFNGIVANLTRAEGLDAQPRQGDEIKKFISNVNGLADQARILQSERKSILQERVPASMGPNLLTLSKDDDVSYEKFCQHVADAT
ncbi:hypothetical protein E4U59_003836 [Claviceps monticola]|nr:hypothetical protein E4U59_003836 [Claviceps monticola]